MPTTKKAKRGKCPYCSPEGGAYLRPSYVFGDDRDPTPVWECSNCGTIQLRRIKAASKKPSRAQVCAAEEIRQYHLGRGYEIKRWIERFECGILWVQCVVGRVGDEGTLLAVLGRLHGHFSIGVGGKIISIGHDTSKDREAKKHPLIYGWRM